MQHRPRLHQTLAGRDALRDLLRVAGTEQLHGRALLGASDSATFLQAASAVSMSSSEIPTWVTIRTLGGTTVQPTPSSFIRSAASNGSRPTTVVSCRTMFVSTR